jgi:hypothetical protein
MCVLAITSSSETPDAAMLRTNDSLNPPGTAATVETKPASCGLTACYSLSGSAYRIVQRLAELLEVSR